MLKHIAVDLLDVMAASSAKLDTEIDTLEPAPLETSLCYCSIIDDALAAHEHLDDCDLHLLNGELSRILTEDHSDTSSSMDTSDLQANTKKRKHRESMARLRHKVRMSIATLLLQERQLELELRRKMDAFVPNATPATHRTKIQQDYFALVQEQIALQNERGALDATDVHYDKYERLVRRELERVGSNTENANEEKL